MTFVTPVLLAGGSGTRLWPLSRTTYPKQFSNLIGKKSLFQQSADRLTTSIKVRFNKHIILTNSDYRFIVVEQLQAIGIDPGAVLIEPESKNTASAILAASFFSLSQNEDSILLVAPSDHIIASTDTFHEAVEIGLTNVLKGKIVTFGIKPTRPETGYGYLKLKPGEVVADVESFIEKPDKLNAKKMFDTGDHLWNSGIFLFRAKDMINAFQNYAPHFLTPVDNSLKNGKPDLGFFRLESKSWGLLEDCSIDYTIMEKAENLVAIPFSGGWTDLGGWDAVWQEMKPNSKGVASTKNAHAIDCKNTLLRAEGENQQIVGLGLKDIVAVAMTDAVLISHMNEVQNVKKIVQFLKKKNVPQAEIFPKDYRPWGWFESLIISNRFQVKRIYVNPGASLSLQSHHHRSEHWIVVEGTAKVTIDKKKQLLAEGESVFVPLGKLHRLENPGKLPMMLIEVQTGSYLGEDDIVRYEDVYKRD